MAGLSGTPSPVTVLSEDKETSVARAHTSPSELWLTLPDLEKATGWDLKPEGVCRDELCFPLSAAQ